MSEITIGGARTVAGTSALPLGGLDHLAATYDGADASGSTSTAPRSPRAPRPVRSSPRPAPLRIGGNTIWGEYFAGQIDEVRVYNRALTAAEIQGDMNRAVGDAGHRAPTAPANLAATGTVERRPS